MAHGFQDTRLLTLVSRLSRLEAWRHGQEAQSSVRGRGRGSFGAKRGKWAESVGESGGEGCDTRRKKQLLAVMVRLHVQLQVLFSSVCCAVQLG
jgi:hypothetical protein